MVRRLRLKWLNFLAAYTAVNKKSLLYGFFPDFLAAYTAVNVQIFQFVEFMVFLAAYTAVN